MRRKHLYVVFASALAAALAMYGWQQSRTPRPASTTATAAVTTLRVQFGITDRAGRPWDGSVTAAGGEIVSVRNWRPRPGDKVEKTTWVLSTRQGPNFQRRAWEKEATTPPQPYVNVPGVIIDVRGSDARLSFQTKNGSFNLRTADVKTAAPLKLLNGAVEVDRVAGAESLSVSDSESEFATVAAGPAGDAWTA